MRRVVLVLAMLPAGLTGIFGIGMGSRWDLSQVATVGTLYLAGSIITVIVILLFERRRLEHELQLNRQQLDFTLRMRARQDEQVDRLAVSSMSRQQSNVVNIRASRPKQQT